jgi:nucleoid DNA-binding protein
LLKEDKMATKRDLVVKIAEDLGMTQSRVKRVIEETFANIIDVLADGGKIEFRNFGIFKIKYRKGRIGRNPRTGDVVPVKSKRVVVFKPGKLLKKKIQAKDKERGIDNE